MVVTVILVLILTATITVSTFNAVANAKITAFAEDLKKVEEAVTLYYEQNDEFPILGENKAYSKAEILEIVEEEKKQKLEEELTLNNDNVENDNLGAFYKIDIAKIGAEQTSRGIQRDDDGNELQSDVYVVAYPSMNVYYLNGLKEKNTFYFSLSSKINRIVKITPNMEIRNEDKSIISTADVTVKRSKKTWTNKLDILIEANMISGEQLFISLEEDIRHQIKTKKGLNTFYFEDSFQSILANSNGEVIETGITSEEVKRFESKPQQQKKLKITKEKDGYVLGEIVVDLSNYDTDLPFRTSDMSISSDELNNIVTFEVADNTSSVKEVKYEYLRKFDEDANANLYYNNIEEYESSYIYTRGKKASILPDGTVQIKVPKDIEGIQVRIFDKAGNASELINLNTTVPVYIGINEKDPTKTSVILNNVIKTDEDINSSTIQISADGKNYTDPQTLNLSDEGSGIYKSIVECEELVGINNNIYIKIIVNYGDNKIETRVKEAKVYKTINSLPEGVIVTDSAKEYIDSDGDKAVIPIGFAIVPGKSDISNGLVISDMANDTEDEGNQFVWIPVNDMNTFVREEGYENGNLQANYQFSDFMEPLDYNEAEASETEEYNKMIASVEEYKGFYVGRYEISNDGLDNVQSKKNKEPWVNIPWGNSMTDLSGGIVEKARAMYNGTSATKGEAVTTLVYGVAWDETVRFISKNYPEIEKDSTGYGNYKNTNVIIPTGSNNSYALNNIYDMAGNVFEWTMEAYNSVERVARGGCCNFTGLDSPVSIRLNYTASDFDYAMGGRVQLYIK